MLTSTVFVFVRLAAGCLAGLAPVPLATFAAPGGLGPGGLPAVLGSAAAATSGIAPAAAVVPAAEAVGFFVLGGLAAFGGLALGGLAAAGGALLEGGAPTFFVFVAFGGAGPAAAGVAPVPPAAQKEHALH